ncbi:glycosyl transferase family 2 [Nitrosococcus halophilus Nc 4]|uniref:Glycosyl transferase family 2 n=1 Tax=Nitrosococcus halophilus (strain Nc4) TaxID=472759 RepID=D5BWR3_NITHN|nr:glycosyltransferase family 2 protein [Nitrosococcus halophilus]ADE13794.1 glycosyl transferase family 2 [Nitrosococcus halophilus Nc 4]
MAPPTLSIVLPAKNEANSLRKLLPALREIYSDAEILVVNDGSSDETLEVAQAAGAKVVTHAYSMGNGAAVKHGARAATGEIIVFMDADGQHDPGDIPRLLERLFEGFDMVVGARDSTSQASLSRRLGNSFYNRLSSWVTGHRIEDLTSGFRVVRAKRFREFLYLLPNGFSYPTTSTMAFFRAGYLVSYVPIHANKREGKSHINLVKDGIRFFLIILKVATLYSPLKVFTPISFVFFMLGAGNYLYTYLLEGRFTNMSALMFITAILVFLMGLISEQIANLLYANTSQR